ncbi:MAG: hypothetical protein AAFQ43_01180, partial [Bacteroidota bacterium]
MRALSFFLGAVIAASAAAQPVTLTPGHPDLSIDVLDLSGTLFGLFPASDLDQSLGTLKESVSRDGDVVTIVSVASVPMAGGTTQDSIRVAWPSFALISTDVTSGNRSGTAQMTASGDVTGEAGEGGAMLPFGFTLPSPAFPGSVVPYVVRALPLDREG